MTTIYGIKNCDTMKKAFNWLDEKGVEYNFHDYKKNGVDEKILKKAIKEFSWEQVLNRKGMTWRKLPKDVQSNMDEKKAIYIALDNPSIIKRPLLIHKNKIVLGFNPETYEDVFL